MIKFLLDALNNCDSKKAKYIKSLYYKYCQFIYDEVNDSIYNNEEIFAMFLSEFIDLNKVIVVNPNSKACLYQIHYTTFKVDTTSQHTIALLREVIKHSGKWTAFHKLLQDERNIRSIKE